MNELHNRGVEDVLLAVVDGLKGFPEAITAVFPHATVQTCIVHLLRHSLDFVSWKGPLEDCQEFRAEVGHDRRKGAHRCRDAKTLAYPTLSSTSCWLEPLYEQLARQAVLNVATFLGHKITPQLAQEIGSRFATRIEGTCIKHRFGKSAIKMYDKFTLVLRLETTTNDVSSFKHHRK